VISRKDDGRVSGKVALVTGAGSGIGRATAVRLAMEGAVVVVADIDLAAAQSCAASICVDRGTATAIQLDVADELHWNQAISAAVQEFGRLDILVNNAGISISKPISELTFEQWRKVLAVNLDGTFIGTKVAIEALRKTGGGSIVNVASVSGIKPFGGAAAYCASKAAIRMFSKAAAIECADAKTGVRVNVVSPGAVKTAMWEKEQFFQSMMIKHGGREQAFAAMAGGVASQQFYSAEEVAGTILFLASDESLHLSGAEIVMDRGHTG
jgi:3(or 17)beta-hydroxysteroid dehydrogenase